MAVLGLSKLDAVNAMLRSIGLGNVTAIPSPSDGSDASKAETFLDYWTTVIQTQGYSDNMREIEYIPSSNAITVGSDVLRIECVAPGRHRGALELKSDAVWNTRENTATIAETVYCNVWVALTWDDCSPSLKNTILAEAIQDYRAKEKQSAELPQIIQKHSIMADRLAERVPPDISGAIPNTAPASVSFGKGNTGGR